MAEQVKYSMSIPRDLYEQLGAMAGKHNISLAQLIRKFFKLGFLMEQNGGFYRKLPDGEYQEVTFD